MTTLFRKSQFAQSKSKFCCAIQGPVPPDVHRRPARFPAIWSRVQVPSLSLVQHKVKMAAVMLPFTEHLHLNQVFPSLHEHLPSYECLTTLLINLTMEGTLSEINSQFRRQVNKGVLRIVRQYLRDNASAARKSSSCLCCHSSVHKIEIIRDKTAS